MRFEQYKKPSIFLILLATLILCLGFTMAFLLHDAAINLKDDARIINEAGIIRGSIQRVTKLTLSDSIQQSNEIMTDINRLLEQFSYIEKRNRPLELEDTFFKGVQGLKEKWLSLERALIEYQKTHSKQLQNKILEESEDCWKTAVMVVSLAQRVTENKVKNVRNLFYVILTLIMVDTILVILFVYLYVKKKLEYENAHDSLTSLYNRRSYEQLIAPEIARSNRYDSPISLILFDIDHFKNINDKHGHKVGDKVLMTLAKEVMGSVRESDSVFRVGGEEFAIISPETRAEEAFKLAEKVRTKVAGCAFEPCAKVTISLGVAGSYQNVTKDNLYEHADNALYLAKNSGRNRTEVFTNGNSVPVLPNEKRIRMSRSRNIIRG